MLIEVILLCFAVLQASLILRVLQRDATMQERIGALFAGFFGVCFAVYFVNYLANVILG